MYIVLILSVVRAQDASDKANNENANLATELEGEIVQNGNDIVSQIEAAQGNKLKTFTDQIAEAESNLGTLRTDLMNQLSSVKSQNQQDLQRQEAMLRAANSQEQEHYKEIATSMNEIKGMANDLDSLLENTQTSVESEIQRLEQASNKFPAALGREVSKATSKATQTAAQVEERVRGSIEDIKKEMAGRVVELATHVACALAYTIASLRARMRA